MTYDVLDVVATSAGQALAVQSDSVNVDGVEVVGLGVAFNVGDQDGSVGEVFDKVHRRQTAQSEIAGGTGDIALNGQTEIRLNQSLLPHGGDDVAVDDLLVGLCGVGARTSRR